MQVKTIWRLPAEPRFVWPLLTQSHMQAEGSCLFALGLPQPRACRLPDGPGRVGGRRQCVSDRGVIEQVIRVWNPPRRLAFEMVHTDLSFHKYVRAIREEFILVDRSAADRPLTEIARTTTVELIGPRLYTPVTRGVLLRIGLKKVHRFVFRNWERLCLENAAGAVLEHP